MRLLFITNDFPYPGDPTRGVFNLHLVLVRGLIQDHEVQVVAPRTWIEAASSRRARLNVLQSDDRAQLAGGRLLFGISVTRADRLFVSLGTYPSLPHAFNRGNVAHAG